MLLAIFKKDAGLTDFGIKTYVNGKYIDDGIHMSKHKHDKFFTKVVYKDGKQI